jgi:hypothetical protein
MSFKKFDRIEKSPKVQLASSSTLNKSSFDLLHTWFFGYNHIKPKMTIKPKFECLKCLVNMWHKLNLKVFSTKNLLTYV